MQTKKRAKPVKFGLKAREAEKKEQLKAEATAAEPKFAESPAEVETEQSAPATPQNTELVDKLSDVPFETDFGTPNEEPAPPAHAAPAKPAKAAAPEPEPEFTATSTNPAESDPDKEEIVKPVTPEPIVSEPEPVSSSSSSIPPIGRANEPIPFNPHETVFNTPPDAGEKKRNPFVFFMIIALVAFLTGLAFMAGIYYAMPNKNFFAMPSLPSLPAIPGVVQPTPTPQLSARVSPTAAPSPEVKLSDYSVKVLNGSGVSGQAARVKAALEAEGFTVASTGNAASNDFAKTQVTYQKRVSKEALDKVLTVLKKTYVVEKETELPATATKESDITITIGKETAN